MEKKQRLELYESLDDLKKIRYSLGFIKTEIFLSVFLFLSLIFGILGIILLIKRQLFAGLLIGVIEYIFLYISFKETNKDTKQREEFLLKYGNKKKLQLNECC